MCRPESHITGGSPFLTQLHVLQVAVEEVDHPIAQRLFGSPGVRRAPHGRELADVEHVAQVVEVVAHADLSHQRLAQLREGARHHGDEVVEPVKLLEEHNLRRRRDADRLADLHCVEQRRQLGPGSRPRRCQ